MTTEEKTSTSTTIDETTNKSNNKSRKETKHRSKKSVIYSNRNFVFNEGSIRRKIKRVLVTGGAGFIGSHLIDVLMNKGYDVLCVDNLFSGRKENVNKWFGHERFEFVRHDITKELLVEVDEIYHLACPASPVFYQNNPIKTIKTCVLGTINMLGLAKRVKARILLASTSEVYGDPKVHPQPEEYWGNVNNIGIRSCYDEGKRLAETLMFDYHRFNKVNICVARIFNTYGPRMLSNDGRVVSNFIVQALSDEDITIYGEGNQTRSFCYIDDQVRGLISLMEHPDNITGPINIGNPDEYTIKQLAELTIKLTDTKSKLTYKPLPSDDPKKRKPDITKAKKYLKWEPTINLEEGLKKTIEYFKQELMDDNTSTTEEVN